LAAATQAAHKPLVKLHPHPTDALHFLQVAIS